MSRFEAIKQFLRNGTRPCDGEVLEEAMTLVLQGPSSSGLIVF